MDPNSTALILIGYQNDYFADDGILHRVNRMATIMAIIQNYHINKKRGKKL